MNERLEARRRVAVPATAMALIVSLIGGLLVLMLPAAPPPKVALKPIPPAIPAAPAPAPEQSSTDLSMFGFGDSGADLSTPDTSGNMYADAAGFTPGAAGAFQLPAGPDLPAGTPIDWAALVAPLIKAQADAQAAGVAGSITGSSVGAVTSVLNSAAIIIGDLLIFAAITPNGPNILNGLQGALVSAMPAAAAAAAAAGLPQIPIAPDLTGLSAAFAAAAAAPPLGVPSLPALPPLPTPEQFAASVAGLSALGALPALPPLVLPGLPPPPGLPQLPRPEEVVGGVVGGAVAIGVGGLILGTLFQPPSITRMLGLPF
ncbi:MAG: hypothetical protein K8R24_10125 [Mycobacterium sp.]|nr:hypothetical protein [Mycobacterium sp.]